MTGERSQIPPLVTTDCNIEDTGNASPRFIRCSTYNIPTTKELLDESKVLVFLKFLDRDYFSLLFLITFNKLSSF